MNYHETLDYLFSRLPMYQRIGKAAYKADLATTIALDEYFGHPHRQFRSVHVAGTNGKGSVSHMLAAVLQEAGYKAGLYTSPHLKDFRERIKINGKAAQEDYVVDFVDRHRGIFESLSPSFFEMTVAMAFDYFAKEKIDIAIVETGMGGRLDSTNIITPILSVITNIGLDHLEFLGNTLPQIAREKAGIIKRRVPVVIGELHHETRNVFTGVAEDNNAPISFASEIYKCAFALQTVDGLQSFNIRGKGRLIYENLESDLLGFYQQKNVITCLQAMDILNNSGIDISMGNIYSGLRNAAEKTGLLGRWQIIGENPRIICDTAHNPEGISAVLGQIRATPYENLHMVIGFVNDKDTSQIIKLLPADAKYYFTQASVPRALDSEILMEAAIAAGLQGCAFTRVPDALAAAKNAADKNDLIFVGGSTFVVADALP